MKIGPFQHKDLLIILLILYGFYINISNKKEGFSYRNFKNSAWCNVILSGEDSHLCNSVYPTDHITTTPCNVNNPVSGCYEKRNYRNLNSYNNCKANRVNDC
tara:strand:+ start:263 stop:568 length:306 start_codon:yes stop_codon:yes gene_type:complete